MRKLSYALAATLLAFGLAGQAQAIQLGFTGELAIDLVGNRVSIPGAGTASVNGSSDDDESRHLTALTIPARAFAVTSFVLPLTDPAAAPIKGLQVTAANSDGSFEGVGASGGFGGSMPLIGSVKVCLFGACSAAVANLNVPLGNVGSGGFAQVTAAVNLTVIGAPWTTGTAAIGTVTQMGAAAPNSQTGAASGVITLVTPIFVSTNIGASAVVPTFGILSMHFVPEPGTLVLLGAGIAGLVSYGRTRSSKA